MESKINRITDKLWKDDGISGAMQYTEQISWILFLKFLNDLEESKSEDTKSIKYKIGEIKNISLKDIKEIFIPLTPLQIQQKIVSKLDKLFEKIDTIYY